MRMNLSDWLSSPYIPNKNELCYAIDANIIKIGDGTHKWKSLSELSEVKIVNNFGTPPYAASIADMVDESQVYIGSNGNLWANQEITTIKYDYTNLADTTTEDIEDPTYSEKWVWNYRLSSTVGKLATDDTITGAVTNLISINATATDDKTIRIAGFNTTNIDTTKIRIEIRSTSAGKSISSTLAATKEISDLSIENNIISFKINTEGAYAVRFSSQYFTKNINTIITIGQEITEGIEVVEQQWVDTGIKYAHYTMTNNDYDKVADAVLDRLDVSYVSSDKVLTVGTYTFRYDGEGIADIGVSE